MTEGEGFLGASCGGVGYGFCHGCCLWLMLLIWRREECTEGQLDIGWSPSGGARDAGGMEMRNDAGVVWMSLCRRRRVVVCVREDR